MNHVVLHRPAPLSPEQFLKLDSIFTACVSMQRKIENIVYTDVDEYGDKVERRKEIKGDFELTEIAIIPDGLMDSIRRPAKAMHIAVHLTRLAAHKPYTRGESGFKIIISDICSDLAGVSEYAVIKACEDFRRDKNLKFFPDTSIVLDEIRCIDRALKKGKREKIENHATKDEYDHKPTFKTKRRVGLLCKLALKPQASWTKWEKRFYHGAKK